MPKPLTDSGSSLRENGIIEALLRNDSSDVISILRDYPESANDFLEKTGDSAAMIIVKLGSGSMFDQLMHGAYAIDYSFRNGRGQTLLDCAMASVDRSVVAPVIEAYRANAPHLINNPPEP